MTWNNIEIKNNTEYGYTMKIFSNTRVDLIVHSDTKIKQEINNATGYDIKGILLHIVNDELWEENKSMQGTQLTIEEDRPIMLYMVRDTGIDGLSNIFREIRCMLDNELTY